MKRNLIILILLISWVPIFSQDAIKGVIYGADNQEPLAFATIFNKRTTTGTASNKEGYFELPKTILNDTIVIAYLGYKEKYVRITSLSNLKVTLEPSAQLMDEIQILASNEYLYDLLVKARKNRKTRTASAKTYYFLESKIDNQKSEVVESYYNGQFSDHSIERLDIKKGRIGLNPKDHRFFLSTGTAQSFLKHDVFNKSDVFPSNPLELNKRKMMKLYHLDLINKYSENEKIVYTIGFQPNTDNNDYFKGAIFIDEDGNILKLNLSINDTGKYPFIPFGGISIEKIKMKISRSYTMKGGDNYVSSIDFEYDLTYSDRDHEEIQVSSFAYLKAYDFDELFDLPIFEFTQNRHKDYRDMTVAPYDSLFWEEFDEFRFFEKKSEIIKFIQKHRIESSLLFTHESAQHAQMQFPYVNWSEKRFRIDPVSTKEIDDYEEVIFDSDKYNFNFKLYLDYNVLNEDTLFQVVSVLDPVGTFYKFFIDESDLDFMNMGFDLLEIQKRKFLFELSNVKMTEKEVQRAHEKHIKIFKEKFKEFKKQTKRGKDYLKMVEWNTYIFEELNIDNLSQYHK